MKDIIADYYNKHYGRNGLHQIKQMPVSLSSTRALTFNSNKKRQNSTDNNSNLQSKPLNSNPNLITFDTDSKPNEKQLPSLSSFLHNIKTSYHKGKKKPVRIKKVHFPFSFSESDRLLIHQKTQSRIEELLSTKKPVINLKRHQDSEHTNKRNKSNKQPEVDRMEFVKEQMRSDQANYNLFKSNSIQLNVFGNDKYRSNLIQGVLDYETRCLRYADLKSPFISTNRLRSYSDRQLEQLSNEMNWAQSNRRLKRSCDYKQYKDYNEIDIQVKGIDSRIAYNYQLAKAAYDRISTNRLFLNHKKKEINDLLNS